MNAALAPTIHGAVQEFCRWQLWFPALMVIIAAVSLYDTYLIIRFEEVIYMMESNPMGRWLLEIAGGQVGVFVRVKLAGTLFVLSTLMYMWKWRVRMLFPVTTSIASYQTCLMIYLTAV
ncbi:MAG: hypothetical protein H7Z17_10170 [Fuerstia sp.]|nr:hypothetical protein [Fuerstiella sp.]